MFKATGLGGITWGGRVCQREEGHLPMVRWRGPARDAEEWWPVTWEGNWGHMCPGCPESSVE